MIKPLTFAAFGVVTLAACSLDPKAYETDPVTVETAQGPVVCQLYTRELVRWDRAMHRPEAMDTTTADNICLNEGERLRNS